MTYEPVIQGKALVFNLLKPIYGNFYGIWDKWLRLAKSKGLSLKVITPSGTEKFRDYKGWINGAKRMERFFKNPNKPMIFYGRDVLDK